MNLKFNKNIISIFSALYVAFASNIAEDSVSVNAPESSPVANPVENTVDPVIQVGVESPIVAEPATEMEVESPVVEELANLAVTEAENPVATEHTSSVAVEAESPASPIAVEAENPVAIEHTSSVVVEAENLASKEPASSVAAEHVVPVEEAENPVVKGTVQVKTDLGDQPTRTLAVRFVPH